MKQLLIATLVLLSTLTGISQTTFRAEFANIASTTPANGGTYAVLGLFQDLDGLGYTSSSIKADTTLLADNSGAIFLVVYVGGSPLRLELDPVVASAAPLTGTCQLYDPTSYGLASVSSGISNKLKATMFSQTTYKLDSIITSVSDSVSLIQDSILVYYKAGVETGRDTIRLQLPETGNASYVTLTKSAHGFSQGQPIYWDGDSWEIPTNDTLIATYVVVDSVDANTFTAAASGTFTTSIADGFYYQNGGTYSITPDTIVVPLFVVRAGKMTINPISSGFSVRGSYKNDANAGSNGVPIGGIYQLSQDNTLGIPVGTIRKRVY